MKYIKGIAVVLSTFVFISCGNSSTEETTQTPSAPSLPAITTPGNVSLNPDTTKQPVVTATSTIPSTTPVITPSTARLNPAHGQPGHRCEIAVGASLDAAPASPVVAPATTPVVSQTNPGMTISPAPASATVTPATTTVAKGMNPAHGQPGHRCDIAVGAPLDSKPTTQPAVTTTQLPFVESDQVKPTPIVTPVMPAKTDPLVTAPGMNPPHGQPGHSCDISVGAPLNSAPVKKNK